jgi:hypothetical protein
MASDDVKNALFTLVVWVPIFSALIQLVAWSRYDLHGRQLQKVRACVHACARASVRARACVCACAWVNNLAVLGRETSFLRCLPDTDPLPPPPPPAAAAFARCVLKFWRSGCDARNLARSCHQHHRQNDRRAPGSLLRSHCRRRTVAHRRASPIIARPRTGAWLARLISS